MSRRVPRSTVLAGAVAAVMSAGALTLAAPALAQTAPPVTAPPAIAPPPAAAPPDIIAPGAETIAPGAQTTAPAEEGYDPKSGQPGKDVVWVPTPDTLVQRMLDMAAVGPQDYLIDLGAGDGRTVIAAAQRGLRAHGIEYNPDMVTLAKRRAEAAGVADRATFEQADIFETDFSKAQVLTLFLLPELNERLRPQILELEPGTRVVSNSFAMGDWEADRVDRLGDECRQWCTALMWIVPAKVEGDWRLGEQPLRLTQTYQKVTGDLGGTPIENGRVVGKELRFTAGGIEYVGAVVGNSLSGTASDGPMKNWTAVRS
ncbi:class I SAM-dependent methyltransferase [Ancylobacter aquaticus]|uniref:class I SAM-dependent methyltransferase n=1 Tax=Ancylobacter aquaticus TaxID=100 RepID=UPI001FE13BC3|nr:class I SAM-dependent methyltransferase [Ancylobacter aquaticus]